MEWTGFVAESYVGTSVTLGFCIKGTESPNLVNNCHIDGHVLGFGAVYIRL